MITEPAPAKLNLALHIRRKRPDGYHDLETLFAFARDGDVVTVAAAEQDSFTITGPFADALSLSSPIDADASLPLPLGEEQRVNRPPDGLGHAGGMTDPLLGPPPQAAGKGEDRTADNLVTRARDAFRATFDCPPVALTLDKRLPVASGVGGGSADAAATLRALAKMNGVNPSAKQLFRTAASLGADVPACLLSRPALGTGKGDRLVALPFLGAHPVLLVNPRVALSTAEVFGAWSGPGSGSMRIKGDLLDYAQRCRNDLTGAAISKAPVIADVLALLENAPGATFVRMSGSGATCFALFEDMATRDAAAAQAKQRGWWALATTLR